MGDRVTLDFHLCETEVVGSGESAYLKVGVTGDARDSGNPSQRTPLPVPALPALAEKLSSHMGNLEIGNYSVDTLLYTYFHQGILTYTVHRSDMPAGANDILNTDFWEILIPKLAQEYPHSNMSMMLNVSSLPAASIIHDGLSAGANLDFCFQVEQNGLPVPVFNLSCPGIVAGTVYLNATHGPMSVQGKLQSVTGCSMFEKWSNVGAVGPAILATIEAATNRLFELTLLPRVNYYLEKGLSIPTIELKDPKAGKVVYISFVNGTIEEHAGYGLIATNASAVVS